MFKYVLCLTFAVSCANAGLIASAHATCEGFSSDFGTTSASCGGGGESVGGFVNASVSGNIGDEGFGEAQASFMSDRLGFDAQINLSEDFVFTVTGGTGGGFFVGCFSGSVFADIGAIGVSGSFGGSGGSIGNGGTLDTCGSQSDFLLERRPFTFGVPQVLPAVISAGASQFHSGFQTSGQAEITWESPLILLFDSAGNPINASFTLVPVPTPEPSPLSLLCIGLMFFPAVAMIGKFAGTE